MGLKLHPITWWHFGVYQGGVEKVVIVQWTREGGKGRPCGCVGRTGLNEPIMN